MSIGLILVMILIIVLLGVGQRSLPRLRLWLWARGHRPHRMGSLYSLHSFFWVGSTDAGYVLGLERAPGAALPNDAGSRTC
jgi:hypothetical protein